MTEKTKVSTVNSEEFEQQTINRETCLIVNDACQNKKKCPISRPLHTSGHLGEGPEHVIYDVRGNHVRDEHLIGWRLVSWPA